MIPWSVFPFAYGAMFAPMVTPNGLEKFAMAIATTDNVVSQKATPILSNAEKAAAIKAEKVAKAAALKAAAKAEKASTVIDPATCSPKDAISILRDSWSVITSVRLGKGAIKFASTLRDKAIINPKNFADWAKECTLRLESANAAYKTLRTLSERKDGMSLNIELLNSKDSEIRYVGMTPSRLLAAIQRDESGILSCDIAR